MEQPLERVTKLEAAERQLRVAIRMFFERKDMIAVHTLATAALQVLDDLARERGGVERVYGLMWGLQPEMRQKILPMMREAQGFFKHANEDPEKVLEFNPEGTKFYLFEAVRLAYAMTGRMAPECGALVIWFVVACPDVFEIDEAAAMERERLSKDLKPDDFERFLYFERPHLINCDGSHIEVNT